LAIVKNELIVRSLAKKPEIKEAKSLAAIITKKPDFQLSEILLKITLIPMNLRSENSINIRTIFLI